EPDAPRVAAPGTLQLHRVRLEELGARARDPRAVTSALSSGRDCDVLVVGGGPAGATAAALLARAGFSVLLCDAATFPRHKICGEYVPPSASRSFARLGVLEEVERLGPRRRVGLAVGDW